MHHPRDLSDPPPADVLAFLEQIKDAPDDDTPRLVFADWLEEHGDPRGAFLRLQTVRARLPRRDPRWGECRDREEDFKDRYRDIWLGPLRPVIEDWQFRRGLVWVWMTAMSFFSLRMQHLALSEAWAWVDGLRVSGLPPDHVGRLADASLLSGLNSLDIEATLGEEGTAELASSPHLGRVTALKLERTEVGPAGAMALNGARHLGALRALDLRSNRLGQAGVEALCLGPLLRRLTHLDLGHNGFGSAAGEGLARCEYLAGLTSLRLGYNLLGNRGAAALAHSPHLTGLTNLELCSTGLTGLGAVALAGGPYWGRLATINLRGNSILGENETLLRERFGDGLQV